MQVDGYMHQSLKCKQMSDKYRNLKYGVQNCL